jgi:hypothetical protein
MNSGRIVLGLLCVTLAPAVWAADDACALLPAAELEAALGGKAAGFAAMASAADASICRGQVGKYGVMIRAAAASGNGGEAERQGLEMVRKMGAQVEVTTEGELTCMTMVAPAALAQLGNNTTCSISRAGRVVAVEVTSPSAADMAAVATVRALVESAAGR